MILKMTLMMISLRMRTNLKAKNHKVHVERVSETGARLFFRKCFRVDRWFGELYYGQGVN